MTRICFDYLYLQGAAEDGQELESGDKDKGSGRAGYGNQVVLTPVSPSRPPPPPPPLHRHTHTRARAHPHTVKHDGDRRNVFEWFSLYLSSGYIFRTFQITYIYQNQNPAFHFYFYSAFVCVAAIDYVGVEQKKKSLAPKYVIYFE